MTSVDPHTILHLPGDRGSMVIDDVREIRLLENPLRVQLAGDQWGPLRVPVGGSEAAADHFVDELLAHRSAENCPTHLVPYGLAADEGVYWGRVWEYGSARALVANPALVPLPEQGERIVFPASSRGRRGPEVVVVDYRPVNDRVDVYDRRPSYFDLIRQHGPWLLEHEFLAVPEAPLPRPTADPALAELSTLLGAVLLAGAVADPVEQNERLRDVRRILASAEHLAHETLNACRAGGVVDAIVQEHLGGGWPLGRAILTGTRR